MTSGLHNIENPETILEDYQVFLLTVRHYFNAISHVQARVQALQSAVTSRQRYGQALCDHSMYEINLPAQIHVLFAPAELSRSCHVPGGSYLSVHGAFTVLEQTRKEHYPGSRYKQPRRLPRTYGYARVPTILVSATCDEDCAVRRAAPATG